MAANSYLTKGQPQFSDAGAPDTAVDPSLVAQYAGIVGNRIVGTSTQRAAFSGIWAGFSGGPWNGLEFEETDTGTVYKRLGGAWKAWESSWIPVTLSLGGVTLGSGGTNVGEYKHIAGTTRYRGTITLGTGGGLTGPVTLTLGTAITDAANANLGTARYRDTSAPASTTGPIDRSSSTIIRLLIQSVAATYPVDGTLSSSTPWNWAATDTIDFDFTVTH